MSGVNINMGFGFGLFAIFGILRYRTASLSIKEMTYLLAVIVLAVLNSVSSQDISLVEQIVMSTFVVIFVYVMEKTWYQVREGMREVNYEKIELIKPEQRQALIADLESRLGVKIRRFEINEIDFLNDSARIMVYYEMNS
jgi:Ca2+/Na+ antiporter